MTKFRDCRSQTSKFWDYKYKSHAFEADLCHCSAGSHHQVSITSLPLWPCLDLIYFFSISFNAQLWTLPSFYDIYLIRFILLSALLSCSGNSAKTLEKCWMSWSLSDFLGTQSQSRRKRGWISYSLASRSTNISVGRFWPGKWRLVPSGKLKSVRIYICLLVLKCSIRKKTLSFILALVRRFPGVLVVITV